MKGTKFYKRNQLIAVYDEDDDLVAVCDNAKEFAGRFKMDLAVARSVLSRLGGGDRSYFIYKGKKYTIHLIQLAVNEVREFQAA